MDSQRAPKIDTTVPHSARIWKYWLGGRDNYVVDREVGDQFAAAFPRDRGDCPGRPGFPGRAVRYLVGEAGIRQLLDIGTGLPTADNAHEVAQRIAPECHIVYVDNDPLVLAHARALLTSSPEGRTAYTDADLRQPETIVQAAGECWTSASRLRSCSWACWVTSTTTTSGHEPRTSLLDPHPLHGSPFGFFGI